MDTTVLESVLPVDIRARLPSRPQEHDAVSAVKQLDRDGVVWLADPGDPERSTWFITPSPARALQWIVEHGTKKGVMEYVRQTRKRQRRPSQEMRQARRRRGGSSGDALDDEDTRDDENVEGVHDHEAAGNEDADVENASNQGSPAKRQKTHTTGWGGQSATRQAMKKLEAKQIHNYHRFFHNSQEEENVVRETTVLRREQHIWLRFVGQQPEAKQAGERAIGDLVCRATTVGNSEAIEDFHLAIQHWRASAQRAPASRGVGSRVPSSSRVPDSQCTDIARDDASDIPCLQHAYRRAMGASRSSAFYHIDHRYHAARVREIYERRCAREADPNADPPLSTQKRGRIQVRLFRDSVSSRAALTQGEATDDIAVVSGNPAWEEFRRTLKHGKRWLALEKDFTCGIFALLPKSRVPSTYLERKVTDAFFALWRRMLRNCSPLVVRMAQDVELMVRMMACDEPPPAWRLELEKEGIGSLPLLDTPTAMLAGLLEREGAQPARIREIASSEPPDEIPSGHEAVDGEVCVIDTDDEEGTPLEDEEEAA
jgi:hypothetical protein